MGRHQATSTSRGWRTNSRLGEAGRHGKKRPPVLQVSSPPVETTPLPVGCRGCQPHETLMKYIVTLECDPEPQIRNLRPREGKAMPRVKQWAGSKAGLPGRPHDSAPPTAPPWPQPRLFCPETKWDQSLISRVLLQGDKSWQTRWNGVCKDRKQCSQRACTGQSLEALWRVFGGSWHVGSPWREGVWF